MPANQYGDEFIVNHVRQTYYSRLAVFVPLVTFPILALCFQNWLLLLGIVFWYVGGLLSKNNIPFFMAFAATITYNITTGFIWNSYFNIFFLCFTFGYLFFKTSNNMSIKLEQTKKKMYDSISEEIDEQFKDKFRT